MEEEDRRGSERVNLEEVIGELNLVDIAERDKEQYYDPLPFDQKFWVDQQLLRLDLDEPFLSMAVNELTSAAVALTGLRASEAIAVIFSTAAAAAKPLDSLAVNNFGAVLHVIGAVRDSVNVLNYARALAPKSPTILINLGNFVYDLGDLEVAEKLYKSAIAADPEYGADHRSLGDLYLERGDWRRVLEEYPQAADKFAYAPSVSRGTGKASDESGDGPIKPSWGGSGEEDSGSGEGAGGDGRGGSAGSGARSSGGSGGSGERPRPGSGQIQIPSLPGWRDPQTLAASLQELLSWRERIIREMADEGKQGASTRQPSAGQISYDKYLYQLSYLGNYYDHRIEGIAQPGDFYTYTHRELTLNMPLEEEGILR
ncbi:MAG: hypothetical protein NUW23_08185 [Firmicutes bacterium]|jgi:tetratricopeptide (TPR) repeat protein|nr:hypothetical protein [Bacillota bacterium]